MPRHLFYRKMLWYLLYTLLLIFISLAIGMTGYHYFAGLGWIDSLYNASMILTGMGPVAHLETDAAKIFASFYALYCGVAFLSSMAILLGPMVHRILHLYHLDVEQEG
jgi:hypothetical protein